MYIPVPFDYPLLAFWLEVYFSYHFGDIRPDNESLQ